MLIFKDGFDHYNTITQKWDGDAQVAAFGTAAPAPPYAYGQWINMQGVSRYAIKKFLTRFDIRTAVFGFHVYFTNTNPAADNGFLMAHAWPTQQLTFFYLTGNVIRVYRGYFGAILGTSVATVSPNAWHWFSIKMFIDNAAGYVSVNVDGTNILNLSGIDTQESTYNFISAFALHESNGNTYFDNFHFCDNSGAYNNDHLLERRITYRVPNANGVVNDFTPSAGTNYQNVDEVPPTVDTDYNQATGAPQTDLYAYPASGITNTIRSVVNQSMHKKTDAGLINERGVVRSGGVNYDSADVLAPMDYTCLQDVRETDPATGLPWTQAGLDAAQFGIKQQTV